MNKITIELSDKDLNSLLMIKNDDLTTEQFIYNIIKAKLNSILLDDGFYYNTETKELYNNKNEKISFRKKENILFNYLIVYSLENDDGYLDIESIKKDVWESEETSIFSIRNVIRAIREKTFHGIIKNKSSSGYRINIK